jgi:hypothetical protein
LTSTVEAEERRLEDQLAAGSSATASIASAVAS